MLINQKKFLINVASYFSACMCCLQPASYHGFRFASIRVASSLFYPPAPAELPLDWLKIAICATFEFVFCKPMKVIKKQTFFKGKTLRHKSRL
jgi:hypothetical protein